MGFPGGSNDKESACNEGDLGSLPGLGRSLGGGHGNPLEYSCLENPTDRGSRCIAITMLFYSHDHTMVTPPRVMCLSLAI